jgi:hypothetical protein
MSFMIIKLLINYLFVLIFGSNQRFSVGG